MYKRLCLKKKKHKSVDDFKGNQTFDVLKYLKHLGNYRKSMKSVKNLEYKNA